MWKNPNIGPFVKEWNIDSIWNRPLFGAPKFPRISRGPRQSDGVIMWHNLDKFFDAEAHAAR